MLGKSHPGADLTARPTPRTCGIDEHIGNTPLVFLRNWSASLPANVFMKLEYLNPWLSVKDRIVKAIVDRAEQDGRISPGSRLIEATSGNTGISLAGLGAARGYRVSIIMPEFVSEERKLLIAMLGAELILTPTSQGLAGPVAKSFEIADSDPSVFIVDQTRNSDNPAAHYATGLEIWDQMNGEIDCFVSASGTGGHISGIGRALKDKNPDIQVIAVEPPQAAVLSGKVRPGEAEGNHGIIGIGPGFIPKTLDRNIIDSVHLVSVDACYTTAQDIMRREGLLVGVSTGAVLSAAAEIAADRRFAGANIVVVAASSAERYLSTALSTNARDYVRGLVPTPASDDSIARLLAT